MNIADIVIICILAAAVAAASPTVPWAAAQSC